MYSHHALQATLHVDAAEEKLRNHISAAAQRNAILLKRRDIHVRRNKVNISRVSFFAGNATVTHYTCFMKQKASILALDRGKKYIGCAYALE